MSTSPLMPDFPAQMAQAVGAQPNADLTSAQIPLVQAQTRAAQIQNQYAQWKQNFILHRMNTPQNSPTGGADSISYPTTRTDENPTGAAPAAPADASAPAGTGSVLAQNNYTPTAPNVNNLTASFVDPASPSAPASTAAPSQGSTAAPAPAPSQGSTAAPSNGLPSDEEDGTHGKFANTDPATLANYTTRFSPQHSAITVQGKMEDDATGTTFNKDAADVQRTKDVNDASTEINKLRLSADIANGPEKDFWKRFDYLFPNPGGQPNSDILQAQGITPKEVAAHNIVLANQLIHASQLPDITYVDDGEKKTPMRNGVPLFGAPPISNEVTPSETLTAQVAREKTAQEAATSEQRTTQEALSTQRGQNISGAQGTQPLPPAAIVGSNLTRSFGAGGAGAGGAGGSGAGGDGSSAVSTKSDSDLLPGVKPLDPTQFPRADMSTPDLAKATQDAAVASKTTASNQYTEDQKSGALIQAAQREATNLAGNPRMVGPGSEAAQAWAQVKTFVSGQPPDALVNIGSLDKMLTSMGAQNIRAALSGQRITNQEFMALLTKGNPNTEQPLPTIQKLLRYLGTQNDYDQGFQRTKIAALRNGADPATVDSDIGAVANRGNYVESRMGVRPPAQQAAQSGASATQKDSGGFVPNQQYKDKNGATSTYKGNGQWQ